MLRALEYSSLLWKDKGLTLPGSDFVVPKKTEQLQSMLWTTEAFCPHHTMLDMLPYPSSSELNQAIIKNLTGILEASRGEEIFTSI